jgi:N-acetylated-alpha-linked acidic dipeptidase
MLPEDGRTRTSAMISREYHLSRNSLGRYNQVCAPGFYRGYGVKTLPAVREVIEEREFDVLDGEVARTAAILQAMASRSDALVVLLQD